MYHSSVKNEGLRLLHKLHLQMEDESEHPGDEINSAHGTITPRLSTKDLLQT